MLNNRQQSGRRRGRGGQRQQGNGGRGPEQGNRIDNRARGNAPQLLEKYKTLARDAQLAGDRVMTEYYLQFADHYFRVVAESRARFEEQRRQRDDWRDDEDEGADGDDRMASDDNEAEGEAEEADAQPRDYDNRRRDRQPRQAQSREPRSRDGNRDDQPREDREPRGAREDRQSRGGNGRDDRYARSARNAEDGDEMPATIDIAVLPPAFGSDGPLNPISDLPMGIEGERDTEVEAPAPKRRGRPRKVAEVSDAG